jgi:hypothetical protein
MSKISQNQKWDPQMNRAVEGKLRLSTPSNFRTPKCAKKSRKNEKISPIPAGRAQK